MLAPIILFVYNRPVHTRLTVEALQKNELATESGLFIFADGPKEDATVEALNSINEVREYINSIEGFKSITIKEAEKNKGLANSVIAGVTEVINVYGKAIIVEDDIITHPFFLRFMNDALSTFEVREDIFMIGGFNHNFKFPFWYKQDIYLTYRSCSWGWATWKDRWNKADWQVDGYQEMSRNEKMQKLFNRGGDDNFPMLKMQMNGQLDSWCIRWDFCMFKHNAFCVIPKSSLVQNCGFDGTGVHCGEVPSNYTAPFPIQESYFFCLDPKLRYSPRINKRLILFLRKSTTHHTSLIKMLKNKARSVVFKLKINKKR